MMAHKIEMTSMKRFNKANVYAALEAKIPYDTIALFMMVEIGPAGRYLWVAQEAGPTILKQAIDVLDEQGYI